MPGIVSTEGRINALVAEIRLIRSTLLTTVVALAPLVAVAQPSSTQIGGSQGASQPTIRLTAPTVVVTAQKEPADIQSLPLSVTAVPRASLDSAAITSVGEAAQRAPNTFFSEFTARKLSFARFRGIGSSPANPGITTYVDGVPQFNTNSSSIEFLDIDQVEFVRGPQSALFGRNTLGGLVNVASGRPSLTQWTGKVRVPLGNFALRDVRASASGPLAETLAVGLAFGHTARDGFTRNDITGHDLDSRSASFGKAQLLWTPAANWEARAIVSGERARDGDYALQDLGALRRNPFHAARDFEGRTDRDVISTTVLARREGRRLAFSTTTGVVKWKTRDLTDLDYTPLPLATRDNAERSTQFSQEVRVASAAQAPVRLSERAVLKWQSGVVFFTQRYKQDAINTLAPFLVSPFISFPVSRHAPFSSLDDWGVGVYAQGTTTLNGKLDVTVGARLDGESKDADLNTFYTPAIAAPAMVVATRSFADVSPQFALAYRVQQDRMIYGSVGRGFKAGGFNPASPAGNEAYAEEHTWHVEGGAKTSWMNGKVLVNAAVFNIEWQDLQLNLPTPNVPGEFYIANVGAARSTGAELEVTARPRESIELFSTLGYARARFKTGSVSSGRDVSGNELPSSPDYTASIGAQYSRPLRTATLFGRGELVSYGAFHYDDTNTEGQGSYSLANFRLGVKREFVTIEGWVMNAFNTQYIPIAFAYAGFAASGFVGENGRPRTWGASIGLGF